MTEETQQKIPSPEGRDWTRDIVSKSWLSVWITFPMAPENCIELLSVDARGCGEWLWMQEGVVNGCGGKRVW